MSVSNEYQMSVRELIKGFFSHTSTSFSSPMAAGSFSSSGHADVYQFSNAEINREQGNRLDEEALQVRISNPRKSLGRLSCGDNMGESIVYEEREISSNMVESVVELGKRNKLYL